MAFTRRHLPHWIPPETDVFVTWRLAGSAPSIPRWDRPSLSVVCHRSPSHDRPTDDEKRSSVPPFGPVCLQDPRIASVVADALLYGESGHHFYRLHAWVVMPNHVHAILRPHTAMPVIMRWLKGRTSRMANQILGRAGTAFWQDESFDHWIRSAMELHYLIEYVENNPLRAGLVETTEQWAWSSAGRPTDDEKRSSVPPRADCFNPTAVPPASLAECVTPESLIAARRHNRRRNAPRAESDGRS
jgi:REP element-mobilizing transposase RayT